MTGIYAIIIGALLFIVASWIYNWGNIREHFKAWVKAIIQIVWGWIRVIYNTIKMFLGAIYGLFTGNFKYFTEGWKGFLNGLSDMVYGMYNTIAEPFRWIMDLAKGVIDWINRAINTYRDSGISGLGSSAMSWGRGLLPFASGGIVTRPTAALIGEAGPEAVIPLNKMGGIGGTNITINNPIVRNDSDINKIAEQVGRVLEDNRRRFR